MNTGAVAETGIQYALLPLFPSTPATILTQNMLEI